MGLRGVAILLSVLACAVTVRGQVQPPGEKLILTGKSASTWIDNGSNVVLLHGPVQITLERATLSADDAVIWLSPVSQEDLNVQEAQIALIGHAKLSQKGITRSGEQLFVTDTVRGEKIRIVADERIARDDSATDLFHRAAEMRKAERPPEATNTTHPSTTPTSHPSIVASRPVQRPPPAKGMEAPVVFEAKNVETMNDDEGNVVVVLRDDVRLLQHRPNNDFIELSAKSAVLFTPLKSLKELQQSGGKKQGRDVISSAYLEGDVRIDYVGSRKGVPEQRMTADRVFYEFATDRAVMTDAIIHSLNPQTYTPILMRASLIRQLSEGEFTAEHAKVTNSTFAVPSYCLAAEQLYMRDTPTGDPRIGDRITYDASNLTMQAFSLPFFYMPRAAGEMTEHGFPLRAISTGNDNDFGTFFESSWGLFEVLGQIPPRDLDASFRLDYYGDRGPGFGFNAKYDGGFVTDTTRQAWDFDGQFKSYLVYDHGTDDVGRAPVREGDPSSLRGQLLWEHTHYFPDGWEAQARIGYVSDATFMEQWFRQDFEGDPPRDIMGYLKHQVDTEAFTLGVIWQPSRLVTVSDYQQEQFEVERFPEIGYYREGDALLYDHATLFSENTADGLHFARSKASLADQSFNTTYYSPGIPAEGYTGLTGQIVWRGDFREELDWPFTVGPFRVDPYVMGRYTEYSDSPQGTQRDRLMAGAGTRITTELWKVDPTVENDFFDVHQLRHVIEPEVNFFTSAMNVQRNQVFVYDEQVDAINDVSAAQFAIHQRWETKRGGPGEWRSVDLLTLNVEVDYFANKPSKKFLDPYAFRGEFFSAYPETSVPRDAVNADITWRLSDNTVLLGDMSYNLDRGSLQTLAIGLLVRRDARMSYFIGNRYIADLDSNITSLHVDYQMTQKYILAVDQQFDFTQGKNVLSSFAVVRRFDTFMIAASYYYDETTKQHGISFNLYPIGLGQGLDTNAFNTFHR